jgi:hypothetical protein
VGHLDQGHGPKRFLSWKARPSTSFDGTGISYIYDIFARPSATTWGGQGRAYQMKQTYNALGQVSQIDYPTTASASTQLKVTYATIPPEAS